MAVIFVKYTFKKIKRKAGNEIIQNKFIYWELSVREEKTCYNIQ